MNYIELFAGCGGLSLGLESVDFELLFANELSPMATETFSYNFFNENLSELSHLGHTPKHTLWLNSKYDQHELEKRLRENPKEPPEESTGFNDLEQSDSELENSILVANIEDLNRYLSDKKTSKLLKRIKSGFGRGGVDLISGGPPCQSFSLAGLRQHDNERNQLPWEFAKFVDHIKPRVVMLENVSGILRAFNINGKKYYAWYEVAKVFSSIGYVPICIHANAKYAGAAQNRPRFIMFAIKEKDFKKFKKNTKGDSNEAILNNSYNFYKEFKKNKDIEYGRLNCYEIEKEAGVFINSFMKPLIQYKENKWRTVYDAIEDLRVEGKRTAKSKYVKEINHVLKIKGKIKHKSLNNDDRRANGEHVRSRFLIYQILNIVSSKAKNEVLKFFRNPVENILSKSTVSELLDHKYLGKNKELVKFSSAIQLKKYLLSRCTKKQTQRALVANMPAPAALSIPDDACHYHLGEARTLTVREMARIQSFPDWFDFRSKVTTGGTSRRFEVPQYTQVGNAVPPLFGLALGEVVKGILDIIDE